jgi:hypothetical protein
MNTEVTRERLLRDIHELLRDCGQAFEDLREAGVYSWPNHPHNPEARIKAILPLLDSHLSQPRIELYSKECACQRDATGDNVIAMCNAHKEAAQPRTEGEPGFLALGKDGHGVVRVSSSTVQSAQPPAGEKWLRLGKFSVAERPEGEVYVLESEAIAALTRPTK